MTQPANPFRYFNSTPEAIRLVVMTSPGNRRRLNDNGFTNPLLHNGLFGLEWR
jgi:hypothetical protein